MMDIGNPWSLSTSFKNTIATSSVVKGLLSAKKWAYLVNLSITTMMVSQPLALGNPLIKSTEILVHWYCGIGKD